MAPERHTAPFPPDANPPLALRIGRERMGRVIAAFHSRVLSDSALAPFFSSLGDHEEHQALVTEFWWRLLGGYAAGGPGRGAGAMLHRAPDMDTGHAGLDIGQRDLETWLGVFAAVLRDELPLELAEAWIHVAEGIGRKMASRGLVKGGDTGGG